MTDKENIRAEIERRIYRNKRNKEFENVPEKRHQLIIEGQLLGELKHFINSMQEEPVSEGLEKEIHHYFCKEWDGDPVAAARHFANWQKEQMIANTADAMIGLPYENKDGGYTHLIDVSRPLPVGNNKIAIIFKEN